MRLRHVEIIIDADKLAVDIKETINNIENVKHWAYILHDKDNVRPHYHIYLNFSPTPADTVDIAKWFKLNYVDADGIERSGEQFICKVKGREIDILLYLIHGNESQKFKHQYSLAEIVSNFNFLELLKKYSHR